MADKQRILIIEDDRLIKDAYVITLQNAGFEVEFAMTGEEGLEKMSSFLPDLLLLDIFLPKMSGFDVIDKLKLDPILSKIPVIVLTNIYVNREDMVKKGVEHCYIKSEITPGEMVEKVKQTLGEGVTSS